MKPHAALPLLFSLLVAAHSAAAQQPGFVLTGQIKGDAKSTAIVIVDDPAGTAAWHARTAKDGTYSMGPIPAGHYRVCIEAPHFDPVAKEWEISTDSPALNVRLNSTAKLRAPECPTVTKALVALTPQELERAMLTLHVGGGAWEGSGYIIRISGNDRAQSFSPLPGSIAGQAEKPLAGSAVAPGAAQRLFQKLYASAFFKLPPPSGVRLVMDKDTTTLTFSADGLSYTVEHVTGLPPADLAAIESEFLAAADSHALLHGAPPDETLYGGVRQDLELPKPGLTPLIRAAATASVEVFQRLIAQGEDPRAADASGWTALMYAASEGNEPIVTWLLAHGANPNAKSLRGETTLMAAIGGWSNDSGCIKALLAAGANPNAETVEGQTALMWAARRARPDAIALLLASRADVNFRARDGSTALGLLRTDLGDRSQKCLELLRAAGATK